MRPAEIALAWLPAHTFFIVPIPSTSKLLRLQENLGVVEFCLIHEELSNINKALAVLKLQTVQIQQASGST
ncbi:MULTISPECIES: aldo/keto reductase [Olivibacter]|uniref:Aldo/keto reductase n=1 Tax=Olivibacter oleidegradans TaxID=760123 RepID=A0ABV6HMP3_9SPHI|nr:MULTISPECIES: aldo/keto reductase [Olivibacter]MDX3915456.1 aldo/keto reductase [Pseudosphingobacterium sp.]QEL02903.1 hypothetical protein FKG96_19460 [Olivibacter sp. LS-1]